MVHYSKLGRLSLLICLLQSLVHQCTGGLTLLCFIFLQGGFDIPERMFYSLKKEWESSSKDNMGDVRELIPEFFYLPDFLLNSNHIQLGQAQTSSSVHK